MLYNSNSNAAFRAATTTRPKPRGVLIIPTVCAKRADGHVRHVAIRGTLDGDLWVVHALPADVHAATGIPRGAQVSAEDAKRVAQAFIDHRAARAPGGEWGTGATVVVTRLDYCGVVA